MCSVLTGNPLVLWTLVEKRNDSESIHSLQYSRWKTLSSIWYTCLPFVPSAYVYTKTNTENLTWYKYSLSSSLSKLSSFESLCLTHALCFFLCLQRNVFARTGVSVWTAMGLVNALQDTQDSTVSLVGIIILSGVSPEKENVLKYSLFRM